MHQEQLLVLRERTPRPIRPDMPRRHITRSRIQCRPAVPIRSFLREGNSVRIKLIGLPARRGSAPGTRPLSAPNALLFKSQPSLIACERRKSAFAPEVAPRFAIMIVCVHLAFCGEASWREGIIYANRRCHAPDGRINF